jgi:hypothetical protein
MMPLFTKHGMALSTQVSPPLQNAHAGAAQCASIVHDCAVVTEHFPATGPAEQIPSWVESRSEGSSRQSAA